MAVSGYGGDAATGEGEAAGVKIIDTRDWSACLLDQGATRIAFTGRTLLLGAVATSASTAGWDWLATTSRVIDVGTCLDANTSTYK